MWPKVLALVAHTLLASGAIVSTTMLALRGDIPGSTAVASITTFAGIGAGGSVASLMLTQPGSRTTASEGQ